MLIIQINGFIFVLDGTLYLGYQALPFAIETIQAIREQGKHVLFISNKPLEPRQNYAAKLTRLGIPASPDEVITSGSVLGYHLSQHFPGLAYYVVGEENLKAEMRAFGLKVLEEFCEQDEKSVILPNGVDAVVIAFDRTLDYRKLNTAYQALIKGARFFATNPDKTCPMPGGGIPDAGATLAALEHLTGRKVELLAGKPSHLMMEVAMQRLDQPAERCLVIGDRLETDIKMGIEAGMHAAVVLTGASTRKQAEEAIPAPDLILENLEELLKLL
jgi:phosphoglycolate/pyridoxal phosphate phosphatase family enzyme